MSSVEDQLHLSAERLIAKMSKLELKLATAESCTGGLLGKVITDISGSSAVFDRGFITYANRAKIEMLGIERSQLLEHGAVSEAIARAMAAGAIQRSDAQASLSITGIAGPGGGTREKPVGTVCFGWQLDNDLYSATQLFTGNRDDVRQQACIYIINQLLGALS